VLRTHPVHDTRDYKDTYLGGKTAADCGLLSGTAGAAIATVAALGRAAPNFWKTSPVARPRADESRAVPGVITGVLPATAGCRGVACERRADEMLIQLTKAEGDYRN
jgi:hypothetical protein